MVDASRRPAMPQQAWNAKRERQYEHIKEGLKKRGNREDEAEEIAARTVNKDRARAGEAKQASRTSTRDISSGRRGGLRSHPGPCRRPKKQPYHAGRERDHPGPAQKKQARLQPGLGR